MIKNLIDFDKLELLSKYTIEYGILTEDGIKTIPVSILNIDGTANTTSMLVKDAMYFTEYGTAILPGKHIFEKSSIEIDQIINIFMSNLLTDILTTNISEDEIDLKFKELEYKINNVIKIFYYNSILDSSKIDTILDIKDENKYLYNQNKLQDYLSCKITKSV